MIPVLTVFALSEPRSCSVLSIGTTEKKAINKKLEEKKEPVSLEDINRLIDKSVILLGQGNGKFAYFGSLNILSMSLISKSDAEYLLKEF